MARIRPEFDYHRPSDAQLAVLTNLRAAYSALSEVLESSALPSRYRSLAATALEESAMWANKAVVLGKAGDRSSTAVGPPPVSGAAFPMITAATPDEFADAPSSEAREAEQLALPSIPNPIPRTIGPVRGGWGPR